MKTTNTTTNMNRNRNRTAKRLVGYFNRLLAMKNEQKAAVLQAIGADVTKMKTREQKAAAMSALAIESGGLLKTESQKFLALDILREPTRVVKFARAMRRLGANTSTSESMAEAFGDYLPLTPFKSRLKSVDLILRDLELVYKEAIRGIA